MGKCYKGSFALTLPLTIVNKSRQQSKTYSHFASGLLSKLRWEFIIAIFLWLPASAQTTLINPAAGGGFESGTTFAANGWTAVNSFANQWYVGTAATGYSGARGVFIGTNSTTYAYSNTGGMVNHFWQDITIPSTLPNVTLSFKIKCVGNSNCTLRAYLAPAGTTVTANVNLSTTYLIPGEPIGGYNTSYSNYTTITLTFTATGSKRLVFSWNNNTTVNNPPAALDDISLAASGCSAFSGTGYVNVSSLPYSSTGRSTCGKANDYTSSNAYTCGSSTYFGGEDEIFEFKPTSSGAITITMSNASSTSSAMMLYQGCPYNPSFGVTSCNAYNQNSTTTKLICTSVLQDTTYLLLVDASSGCYSYDIAITAPGTAIPNDLPCGATTIALGTQVSDDNTCAGGASEPSTPSCWVAGNLNSLWYKFIAPSSGSVHVSLNPGTLTTTQIELFSGACGSLTSVSNTCVDYYTMQCPGATYTGLTSGSTYYIRVDGYNNDVGSYGIIVDNNSGTLTPTEGDCAGAVVICGTSYNSPGESFGCGNVSEFSTCTVSDPCTNPNCCNSGCLLSGELRPRWYRFDIATSGLLAWTLNCPTTAFFDWELWNITNSSCAAIASNSLAPVACNWNGPATGLTGAQSSPPPGNSLNFETPISVTAGETYVLCQTNYSGVTTPYTYDFSNSTCTFAGSVSTWNGYGGTSWSAGGSWSGCQGVPACSVSGVINSTANQPVISANASVKDLTINSGATLTINAGITLTICGNFTNNGTLTAASTSTIKFNGTGTQTISGSFTGTNKFGNITIDKTAGSVVLNNDIDIASTFTTSTSTSVFNANGKYVKLAGHFMNSSGSTTYTNVGSGTLEFNGAANQNYSPGGSLSLNNVKINQTATSTVTLVGYNMTLGGTLTLTNGRISTSSYEVSATSTSTGSVTVGNTNSYVDGNLRRAVNSTGSYDFPVGQYSSGKGYQRANINFTSASNVTNLLANFQAYGSVPAALGTVDCGNTYSMPALNNGYWTITSTPSMTSGAYTTTLYNTAGTYNNQAGANNWTVMKNDGSWQIVGTCAASTINQVVRTGMSSFSLFGTAQSPSALPIELLSFTGAVVSSGNWLQWVTSSEINNDYFVVEKSAEGASFTDLLKVSGAGTSKDQHNYEGYDFNPVNGLNYYRLRQVDFDGHTTYSDIISLRNYSQSTIVTSINPNPTTGEVHINLNMPIKGIVKIDVLDIFGATLNSFSTDVNEGSNTIPTSLNVKEGGVYMLRITCDEIGYSYQTKVVKY